MPQFIKPEDAQWSKVRYIKLPLSGTDDDAKWQYEFVLPAPLSEWDVFSYWEVERTLHMRKNLKKGEVLFDIGTEQGWLNLAYAEAVGPENIVLIEPAPEFWPNIYNTWQKNFDVMPKGFYDGLFSDVTTDPRTLDRAKAWPETSHNDLIDRNRYDYIHDNFRNIPQIKLDDYVMRTGIIPDAITMDVEGAELLVLKGAKNTLIKHKPKVWISIHPDLGERDYGVTADDTIAYMHGLGYTYTYIAQDHEIHGFFEVVKK